MACVAAAEVEWACR